MLTDDQLLQFALTGYLVLSAVVPEELLDALDDEVDGLEQRDPLPDGHTGFRFWFEPPDALPAADRALRESGALALAEELVAPHRLEHALDHIQVALNVPPFAHRPGIPHLDGNTPDLAAPATFTMLAGVFLSDDSEPERGNLWVWPGSHRLHEELFRERGTDSLLAVGGHAGLLEPPVVYGSAQPLLARRGDLLLAHYQLGHNIGGNTSDRTRRIAYYRLGCEGHAERSTEALVDLWHEYAPVRAVLDGGRR